MKQYCIQDTFHSFKPHKEILYCEKCGDVRDLRGNMKNLEILKEFKPYVGSQC